MFLSYSSLNHQEVSVLLKELSKGGKLSNEAPVWAWKAKNIAGMKINNKL